MLRLAVLFVLCFPLVAAAQMRLAIDEIAEGAPVSGAIEIGDIAFGSERIRVPLGVDLPALWAELDAAAVALGNLTGSDLEFYWLGPTALKSADNGALTLTSKGKLKTILTAKVLGFTRKQPVEVTSGFDVRLVPTWDSEARALRLNAEVTDIHDLPVWAKGAVAGIGVPLDVDVPLFSADDADLVALDLDLHDLTVTGDTGGAQVSAVVSISAEAGRQAILQMLYR